MILGLFLVVLDIFLMSLVVFLMIFISFFMFNTCMFHSLIPLLTFSQAT